MIAYLQMNETAVVEAQVPPKEFKIKLSLLMKPTRKTAANVMKF